MGLLFCCWEPVSLTCIISLECTYSVCTCAAQAVPKVSTTVHITQSSNDQATFYNPLEISIVLWNTALWNTGLWNTVLWNTVLWHTVLWLYCGIL